MRNSKPTPKQRKAAKLLLENAGSDTPQPIGKVMLDAGYGAGVAQTPSRILESRGFLQVLEEAGVTDDKLSTILNEGLGAVSYVKTERVEGVGKTRIKTEEIIPVTDHNIRHKFLETALKVKGFTTGGTERPAPPTIQNNQFNIIGTDAVAEFTKSILDKTKMTEAS
jgi:hypothetical protein